MCGGHAFDCAGNKHVLIENVWFKGFADYKGDRWFSAAVQLDLMRSAGNFGAFGAYDQTVSKHVTVRDCYFSRSENLGGYARGIDSHTSTDGFWYSDIRIENNDFEDTTEYAISGNKWEDVLISRNRFKNCASGVRLMIPRVESVYTQDANGNPTNRVNKVKRLSVKDNTFTNIKVRHAIQVYGRKGIQKIDDVDVSGNKINGVKVKHAIHLSDVDGFLVSNNQFRDIKHHGVLLTRCSNGKADLNVGRDIEGNGVRVELGSKNIDITYTTLREVGYSGISVSGDSEDINVDFSDIQNAGKRTSSSNPYYGIIFMDGVTDSAARFNKVRGKNADTRCILLASVLVFSISAIDLKELAQKAA